MDKVLAFALLVTGALNFYPLVGVLGGARLQALYGLPLQDANLLILMRHRAVLFGLLGAFIVAAAFKPAWQSPAIVAALVSMLSFVVLASGQDCNAALRKVVIADIVASALLGGAWLLRRLTA